MKLLVGVVVAACSMLVSVGTTHAESSELIYAPFSDDYLIDNDAVLAPETEGSDREVQPGLTYFETLPLLFSWNYEDLAYSVQSSQPVKLRCAIKDYSLKRCALVLNQDVFLMVSADSLTELNANLNYVQVYSRIAYYAGHPWHNSSLAPFGTNSYWMRVETIPFASYPAKGYKAVKVKGLGKWTFKKEVLADIVSITDARLRDSVKESQDFTYSVALASQPDVCVRYLPSGDCEIRTSVFTRTAANILEVSKERSDGMPFRLKMILTFDSRYAQTNELDFYQTITNTQIIE